MDTLAIESLSVINEQLSLPISTAPTLKRDTEQHLARFRAAITDPRNLALLHADATIALIPLGDHEATRSGLKAAQRAQRRQRKVQYLFTLDERDFATAGAEEFTLDLRDAIWGATPQVCFGGWTAEELRVRLGSIVAARQIWDEPEGMAEETIVLNGRQIYIIDEVEDGVFSCVAPDAP